MNKTKAIIVDLDGTLCDVEHRVHHVQKSNKAWHEFHSALIDDKLNHWCFELMNAMNAKGYATIFVTGRGEEYRIPTEKWLLKHQVNYQHLYMRGVLDHRDDADVKEEIYSDKIKSQYQILFVVDDRKSVVERWRKLELICLQCAPGDF